VAAAVGYGPLHVGTDMGGSIRLPASWCGVVGFKPSAGRVPSHPSYTGRVVGPLARSVTDVALAMHTLSQPDGRDATSLPWQPLNWLNLEGLDVRGLRIGLWLEAGWGDALQTPVREAIQAVAHTLVSAGAVVEPVERAVSTRAMAHGLDVFWRMRSWMAYQKLAPERQAQVLPYLRQWIEPAAHFTAAQVFAGHSQIAALRDAAVLATRAFDFVVAPVSPDVAFAADWASPCNDPARPFEHIAYTLPWNMSEQSAVTLNAGWTAAGLPIGVQLIGRRHDDVGVLRLARWWERARPAQRPWPRVVEKVASAT
jgi:Asp-tRNA(Asn)/Glu-tRNA(Gln) amidotransferase A subunit family amidase